MLLSRDVQIYSNILTNANKYVNIFKSINNKVCSCRFNAKHLQNRKKLSTFAPPNARMAESVDAPVSNTGGAIHPGSIPGLGTKS